MCCRILRTGLACASPISLRLESFQVTAQLPSMHGKYGGLNPNPISRSPLLTNPWNVPNTKMGTKTFNRCTLFLQSHLTVTSQLPLPYSCDHKQNVYACLTEYYINDHDSELVCFFKFAFSLCVISAERETSGLRSSISLSYRLFGRQKITK